MCTRDLTIGVFRFYETGTGGIHIPDPYPWVHGPGLKQFYQRLEILVDAGPEVPFEIYREIPFGSVGVPGGHLGVRRGSILLQSCQPAGLEGRDEEGMIAGRWLQLPWTHQSGIDLVGIVVDRLIKGEQEFLIVCKITVR